VFNSHFIYKKKGVVMANYLIEKESKEILEQMGIASYNEKLLCPVLKVLQMRHKDLDVEQALKVIKSMMNVV
jgi:hypothetical protein